ncbi:bifunctional nicotinamide-nucleotide adenylyltransferase/Nudix hydroxylase [Chitinibacteraceae bacterium HSL-7]
MTDYAVLIGRFQPFHLSHRALLDAALSAAREVVVVLGSAHQARDVKNPFSADERAAMISATLGEDARLRVHFVAVRDYFDDVRWAGAVERAVTSVVPAGSTVTLVGHRKDASSAYLARFPRWQPLLLPSLGELDATSIRQMLFEIDDADALDALLATRVPRQVALYLRGWRLGGDYPRLKEEYERGVESRRVWGSGPFITVDAVVRAAGHVLLIQRGHAPGKGLWALPGGFLDARERVLQGAIRELHEETRLGLAVETIESALKGTAVFDHPDRSQRGRTITHAHFFDLNCERLPEVEADDDAAHAEWVPLARIASMEEALFEDHFHILNHFLELAGVD